MHPIQRLFILFGVALGFTYSGLAAADMDVASFRNNCLQQEYATCVAANPITNSLSGIAGTQWLCSSKSEVAQFNSDCDKSVAQFCANSTTDSYMPSGCPAPKLSLLKLGANQNPNPTPSPTPSPPAAAAPAPMPIADHKIPPAQPVGPDLVQAQEDLADCQSKASNAATCCGDPKSCGGLDASAQLSDLANQAKQAYETGDTQSLNQICSQISASGNLTASVSNSFSQVCSSQHNGCSLVCSQYAKKWQNQLVSCSGACDSDTLTGIIEQFGSAKAGCDSLQSAENNYKQAALNQASNAGAGQYCSQAVAGTANGMNPSSAGANPFNTNGSNPNPAMGLPQATSSRSLGAYGAAPTDFNANNPVGSSECGTAANVASCMNCLNHPDFPSCASSDSSQGLGAANAPSPFTGDVAALPSPTRSGSAASLSPTSAAAMNATARAGLYGAMAAAFAQGSRTLSSFASPNRPEHGPTQVLPTTHTSNTNVLLGERSVSILRTVAGTGYESSSSTFHPSGWRGTDRSYVGMDLKQYLPGGGQAPRRNVAGTDAANPEIGPISVDIFKRVTQRLRTVCARGDIIDCR